MRKYFCILVVCVTLATIGFGCGKNMIAEEKDINTSPLNYLATVGERTDFYRNLDFENRIRVMTKKNTVIVDENLTGKEEVKFEDGKVIISTGGKTFTFSNDDDNRQVVAAK